MIDLNALPRLETDRLILRGWRREDAPAFAAMMAEREVAQYITVDQRPQDAVGAWRILAMIVGHWALRGYGLFAVEEKASGAFVGRVGAWNPEGWVGFEIGWALARPHWGKGYAVEAARAAGDWAMETFNLSEIVSLIHVDNLRSQNVARRLGETPGKATLHVGMPHTIWRASRAQWQAAR
ncbi:MAG: GNAT family N-acetyltransferase [Alphaproteobacteria bacterium]|nr:GNAT family N-acetyltransferase [Alphaproteobacteria bacterium]